VSWNRKPGAEWGLGQQQNISILIGMISRQPGPGLGTGRTEQAGMATEYKYFNRNGVTSTRAQTRDQGDGLSRPGRRQNIRTLNWNYVTSAQGQTGDWEDGPSRSRRQRI
jgi:hypothetical protein